MDTCQTCGAAFEAPLKPGRRPRFCTPKCRLKNHRLVKKYGIPGEMAAQKRWVKCQGKRPIQTNGRAASTTKPATWATISQVSASTAGDGYGYMLGGGIGCIDLDHCIYADGTLTALAVSILDACPDTYIEVSASGAGLHIFGMISEGPGWKRGGVEIYSRERFIRMTGKRFERPGQGLAPILLANLDELAAQLRDGRMMRE